MEPFTDVDRASFEEGRHSSLYRLLGAHSHQGGTSFRVWAPHARSVQVIGDFDDWGAGAHFLTPEAGLWSGFVPNARPGERYKYQLVGPDGALLPDKVDPFTFAAQESPATAGVIADLSYAWRDDAWMSGRAARAALEAPISIYEVHLGSWRHPATYRALAVPLAEYVSSLGFTHVELLPIMEHPFYGSWGYETTGYFAPTSRYGSPQDFMYLVETLHQHGIGVILDWVPAHFPDDPHALGRFDGTPLYEHGDPRRTRHPEWDTLVFNHDAGEVRSFLISSACFWLERYHADGLRVDAVTSLIHRDYAAGSGEWTPRELGGREDTGGVRFVRALNEAIDARFPGVRTYAEDSSAWPQVTGPVAQGGLGFGFKWDLGWTHDTLAYFARDVASRPQHHRELTFRSSYADREHFVAPLSHDDVGDGAGSLLERMPGDEPARFATLRALLGYQFAVPGKKLLFMGTELAPMSEWSHEQALDWTLLDIDAHAGINRWVRALNQLYVGEPALHIGDCAPSGFEWVIADDTGQSVVAFLRHGGGTAVLVIANFGGDSRADYRVGVPQGGRWVELLNSDDRDYGGSGDVATGGHASEVVPSHGHARSLVLRLPPLSIRFLRAASPS